ncbi:DUF3885 domain-containing protein [Agrobacterium sp. rho-13.3]|jgi:hypothetical protein|uniref:DUF3885 domain-containing protein n=1 Tax=Agrobacterium sp. rho-13.3 TaxID=3072980 RepID=UPI002A1787E5|nr:hypothetical protein [Agrobacterium sp. rho-13.3]MDX8311167.1 hypothetical protein [Agrobacterium sp. rho-13.3]
MSSFEQEWVEFHGEVPPLGFELREMSGKPWVRFHALPNSDRYPSNRFERNEVRKRAIILGNEFLGEGVPCWLVQCRIEEYEKPYWKPLTAQLDPQLRYRDTEDDFHWVASALPVVWNAKKFNDLLVDISKDRTGPTLWFSRKTGKVFAPYDGGFDLFPTTEAEVVELKQLHSGWLSPEPSGL